RFAPGVAREPLGPVGDQPDPLVAAEALAGQQVEQIQQVPIVVLALLAERRQALGVLPRPPEPAEVGDRAVVELGGYRGRVAGPPPRGRGGSAPRNAGRPPSRRSPPGGPAWSPQPARPATASASAAGGTCCAGPIPPVPRPASCPGRKPRRPARHPRGPRK